MHKHIRRSTVITVFQKLRLSAKQCSGFVGKISKSELCTGTAEEVLHVLCFSSEGSSAKQCSGFGGQISKSEMCTGTAAALLDLLCFRRFDRAKYCFHSLSERSDEQNMVFPVFKKVYPSKIQYLLCFRGLRRAKHCIYYVRKGSADQSRVLTVFSKAQASKSWYFYCD